MIEPQTVQLEISPDAAFLPYVRQFVSDSALAVGFGPHSAGLAESETDALFSRALDSLSPGLLKIECHFEASFLLRISVFDPEGQLWQTREIQGSIT